VIAVGEATAISFGRTRLIAFATTLENILRTLVPFGLIWFGFDIWTICLSFVGVRIVALIVYLSALGSRISLFAFNKADFIKSLNVSPTFAGTIILSSLNWQAAIILLAHLSTEVESAKYGVASRFLIPVTILMASYANVIQPVIARYTQNSAANIALYLSRMASYPLILATLGAIASPFLSPTVLVMLFGDKYADAAPTLDVVALSVVPFCLVIVVARGLVAANSQHIDLFANALGVITSIVVGLILIPKYGAWGAALAQLFSLLLMALIEIGYLSKKVIGFSVWRTASLSLGSLLIIYAFLWKL
jgi:O-antigen/teichoic acid export membrane protein